MEYLAPSLLRTKCGAQTLLQPLQDVMHEALCQPLASTTTVKMDSKSQPQETDRKRREEENEGKTTAPRTNYYVSWPTRRPPHSPTPSVQRNCSSSPRRAAGVCHHLAAAALRRRNTLPVRRSARCASWSRTAAAARGGPAAVWAAAVGVKGVPPAARRPLALAGWSRARCSCVVVGAR